MLHAAVSKMVKKHVVILGAGISGLSLGWFLKEGFGEDIQLTILEKASRTGGWISTSNENGFLFEQGPRGCRPHGEGAHTLDLVEKLGLQQELIVNHADAKKRYIYMNGKLVSVPFSPALLKLLLPLFTEWSVKKSNGEDETIYDFISRRLSVSIADTLIDPLVSGIYAGDIKQLSIKSCFPLLHKWEQENGSLTKGILFHKKGEKPKLRCDLFSFKNGMQTLTNALTNNLKGNILLNSEVKKLQLKNEGIEIVLKGSTLFADHLFSALPIPNLASLLNDEELSNLSKKIPASSLAVVNVGFHNPVLPKQGFGYLVPSKEKEKLLGMVWDSSVFPQQNKGKQTRLTLMIKGDHRDEWKQIALQTLDSHLQIKKQPDLLQFKYVQHAIPQYHLGHAEIVKAIEKRISSLTPSLTPLGTSLYGVSVNECISNANKIKEEFCKKRCHRYNPLNTANLEPIGIRPDV